MRCFWMVDGSGKLWTREFLLLLLSVSVYFLSRCMIE